MLLWYLREYNTINWNCQFIKFRGFLCIILYPPWYAKGNHDNRKIVIPIFEKMMPIGYIPQLYIISNH